MDLVARREYDHALDEVPELANISGSRILDEDLHRLGTDPMKRAIVLLRILFNEVSDEDRDILAPLPQRWQMDAQDIQAIEQIAAEGPLLHLLAHRPIRRGDDAHVDADRRGAAEPHELPLLEHAEQLHLRPDRDLPDLVEEDRAAVCQLEATQPPLRGARERALLVAKELTLEQRLRKRADVDGDKRFCLARA